MSNRSTFYFKFTVSTLLFQMIPDCPTMSKFQYMLFVLLKLLVEQIHCVHKTNKIMIRVFVFTEQIASSRPILSKRLLFPKDPTRQCCNYLQWNFRVGKSCTWTKLKVSVIKPFSSKPDMCTSFIIEKWNIKFNFLIVLPRFTVRLPW